MIGSPKASRDPALAFAWRVVAGLAALLIAFLVGGFLLPGTWSVERSIQVEAPPEQVFQLVHDLRRWEEWTAWSDLDTRVDGPHVGVGAQRRWDDPQFGRGVMTVLASEPPRYLRYEVLVDDGAIRTEGSLTLTRSAAGTEVTWQEQGDFGWNPLLSYMALGMPRLQGDELEKGLERLAAAAMAEVPD